MVSELFRLNAVLDGPRDDAAASVACIWRKFRNENVAESDCKLVVINHDLFFISSTLA